MLTEYFLKKHSLLLRKNAPPLNSSMMEILTVYPWPGNIRELENLLRRIVVLGDPQTALDELQNSFSATNKEDQSHKVRRSRQRPALLQKV